MGVALSLAAVQPEAANDAPPSATAVPATKKVIDASVRAATALQGAPLFGEQPGERKDNALSRHVISADDTHNHPSATGPHRAIPQR